jgi:L-aspartate oxidase
LSRIVVVGSGIAGLIAAHQLSTRHHVTLVSKAALSESNTRWAQGGIAAAMFADDSVEEHIADTLRAGAGLCNREAVEILCTEGPDRIRDLIRLGVEFDVHDGKLARGLEAAHSRPRVLHAGGDATGLSIEMALVRAVRAANITVLEHTFACDLLVSDERVTGLEILTRSGLREKLPADAVVLASGGAGQLYAHTTNPSVATGDGVAIALRAGAQLADAEFYQFHPTALVNPGTFLISEAVRGEGAVLRDEHGHRFMQHLHRDAELAPRDVVARGIARQMSQQRGRPVMLDATRLGADYLRTRFPTIDTACRSRDLDWAANPIPVTPAAHYWMGGVRTDFNGRTSVRGLYAIGEVACTGVHGANRLASNSLLESLVFAWRCAALLLEDEGGEDLPQWTDSMEVSELVLNTADSPGKADGVTREDLQALMWRLVGIERNAVGLHEAATRLCRWTSASDSVEALETANLLSIAKVVVAAALMRQESRGAHFRADYPRAEAAFQRSLPFVRKMPVLCR